MKQVYYKQNEKFEYEFFNDKECKEAFEFNGEDKNFYLELKEGNISPITALNTFKDKKGFTGIENVFIPYIPECQLPAPRIIKTLKDITPNYSKYIPKECAVMFLEEVDLKNYTEGYKNRFPNRHIGLYINDGKNKTTFTANNTASLVSGIEEIRQNKKVILFTPELTSSNIKQINDTAKVLKENFDIEWVGVFTPLCFVKNVYKHDSSNPMHFYEDYNGLASNLTIFEDINQLITTNATGLLEPQESEHLKVIDCKEIFEEYIKTNE